MILMLRDDNIIEIFESPADLPRQLEAIDIENEEYRFCDERGQRYVGFITRKVGVFTRGAFELRPEGQPELGNVVSLIDQAVGLAANKWYRDLASLRRHLTGE